MGYTHDQVNKALGSASITGGYFYRSLTDPCMFGRLVISNFPYQEHLLMDHGLEAFCIPVKEKT